MKNKLILFFSLVISGLLFSCEDDDEINRQRLDVDFTADVQNVAVGEPVSFEDLSIGNVSKWNWTFQGGTPPTSTLQSPEVIYEKPGEYSVKLEVSNAHNSVELIRENFIIVSASPVNADFEASSRSVIAGTSVVFTDLSSGNPIAWEWEFIPESGTTITSSEQNPVLTFEEPGRYSVKLTASNEDNSHQVVKENFLTVLDASSVEADFNVERQYTYTGGSLAFSDNSVGSAEGWNWTFEGGTPATSNQQNPTVTYNTPGVYKVSLESFNDTNSSVIEKEAYVVVVPGNDLVAYYPFDGSGIDAGPNKINPEELGTVGYHALDRKASGNNAAVFDGASALVVPDNDLFNFGTSDFTIGVWVKTDDTSKMMVWQESGAEGPGDNQAWLRMGDNSSDRVLRFATEDAGSAAILNMGVNDVPEGGLTNSQWHYVVAVRQGTRTSVYVDGELVKELNTSTPKDISNAQDFKIGVQEQEGDYHTFYSGQMDDMIIYSRALTLSEIKQLYNL